MKLSAAAVVLSNCLSSLLLLALFCRHCSSSPATYATTTVAGNGSCPTGQTAKYMRLKSYELSADGDVQVAGQTEAQCIQSCTNNQQCRSFDYDFSTSICFISSQLVAPTGTGTLQLSQTKNYYEKLCIDNALAVMCPNIFEWVPQHISVGYAKTVTDATSYQDCLKVCINSQTLFGFNCTSGMYYYADKDQNCILNSESRQTKPDFLKLEVSDIVDYFEPNCVGSTTSGSSQNNTRTNRHRNNNQACSPVEMGGPGQPGQKDGHLDMDLDTAQ